MTEDTARHPETTRGGGSGAPNTLTIVFGVLVLIGGIAFLVGLFGRHPSHIWQAYLINFMLWTGLAAGGVLFSAVMQVTEARWSGRLAGIAESFAAFFPVSFVLFLILFLGQTHIFPWLHEDLHGKEVWLNVPFLFARDAAALLILYGVGFGYLYNTLRIRYGGSRGSGWLREELQRRWAGRAVGEQDLRTRASRWAMGYCLSFTLVLSLLGYDLVMAADPHWISTLFGAYTFVKAFYLGLGGLIIAASIAYLRHGDATGLTEKQFHDVGKLFLAFCLVWGDFFYVQLVVIWYGNISEETAYVIERTMLDPWRPAAWIVFLVCFVGPFLILINRKIKTVPWAMIVLCSIVVVGMYLEHLLLLGPALSHGAERLPINLSDLFIFIGFFGLMAYALTTFMNQFPETVLLRKREAN
jgi:Ni/Fe-hydrogenase subunit HybB-like protein